MPIQYLPVSWNEYHSLSQSLAAKIINSKKSFDEIVAIARGGLVVGRLLSDFLQIPISTITIQSYTDIQKQGEVKITAKLQSKITDKNILLVDDLADSGKTLKRALKYLKQFHPTGATSATLFYKPHSMIRPDYYVEETDRWILFPFEVTEWVTTFTKQMHSEGKTHQEILSFLFSLGYSKEQILFIQKIYTGD